MKHLTLLFISLIFLIACQQQEKKNEIWNAQKIATITVEDYNDKEKSFTYIPSFDIDQSCNLFLLDNPSSTVKKIAKTGKFIKSFCRNGQGPGEVNASYDLAILGDTVYVEDTNLQRMVCFDLDGNFRKAIPLKNAELPIFIKAFGNNKFVAQTEKWETTAKGKYRTYSLTLYNSKFEVLKTIKSFKEKYDPKSNSNYLRQFPPFCVSKNQIFVSAGFSDKYEILVYDENGNQTAKISKPYRKIAFNDEEMKVFKKYIQKNTADKTVAKKLYKNAINYLYFDNETGYLWVNKALERKDNASYNPVFDIYQNQKYLKTISLQNIFFENNFFDFDDLILFIRNKTIYYLEAREPKITIYSVEEK